MRTFRYDKLIRDKILADMEASDEHPVHRVLSDSEYIVELKNKLVEETGEMVKVSADDLLSELADVQEVIDCLVEAIGSTTADIALKQRQKNDKSGSFKKRIYIETSALPDDNKWIKHFEANPDRYPEVL